MKSSKHIFYYNTINVLQFQGVGYGAFTVCLSRRSNFIPSVCKTVADYETVWFNITNTNVCGSSFIGNRPCYGIYFKVQMDSSLVKCVESECRYPDQVRFIIRHEGLRCIGNRASTAANHLSNLFVVVLFITLLRTIVS